MRQFAALIRKLELSSRQNEKVLVLSAYFQEAAEKDRVWAIALLSQRRPSRTMTLRQMKKWALEFSGIPEWLFEESYQIVGDLAETIALILPPPTGQAEQGLSHWIETITELKGRASEAQKALVFKSWEVLDKAERFQFNKLVTGSFRVSVSQRLMTRALSLATGMPETVLAHRISGGWDPESTAFQDLVREQSPTEEAGRPYPFQRIHPLEEGPNVLGETSGYLIDWKWEGIRCQLIRRSSNSFIWSEKGELITGAFPAIASALDNFPEGLVLDGEIVIMQDAGVGPASGIEKRLGMKKPGPKALRELPAAFIAFDILEREGTDLRDRPLLERKQQLLDLAGQVDATGEVILFSDPLPVNDWADVAGFRAEARNMRADGLLIKKRELPYRSGDVEGPWLHWKPEAHTINALLIYATRGQGGSTRQYTDLSFAVWAGDQLVPFTRTIEGLPEEDMAELSSWIRENTVERFGPVRSVRAEQVFEIAFEGIEPSSRHRSGLILRSPRILRWCRGLTPDRAGKLSSLKKLL